MQFIRHVVRRSSYLMKKNIGTPDRVIRIVIAVIIVILFLTGQIAGTLAIVLDIIAAMSLLTGLSGRCPAYIPFGISTMKHGS
jgi:hypothetical protein